MITSLQLKNFKSWKDIGDLPLAPLTGFFGTNSSGKSSILQMLLMLKQTAESSDRSMILKTGDIRSYVDLGTFSDFIYNHDIKRHLKLSLSWKLKQPIHYTPFDATSGKKTSIFSTNQICFETSIQQYQNFISVLHFVYDFIYDNHTISFGMNRDLNNYNFYKLTSAGYDMELKHNDFNPLPKPIKCYGFPDEAIEYYQYMTFLPKFAFAFENLFSQIRYIGPLREPPKRYGKWSGEIPLDVGTYGENVISALLASQKLGMPIEDKVEEWMQKVKLLESFQIKPISYSSNGVYGIRVKQNHSSPEVSIADVGFGVSQILPVLVLCYYVPIGSIILLEQPEIHLHPSVQADLADVLIDVVKNRNVQIILESHSEHLLRRIQRRIAEEIIPSDKVNLYFCRMENGESKIEKLQLDDEGYISNWPQNFFGDDMGDLVAMTEATTKRKGVNI